MEASLPFSEETRRRGGWGREGGSDGPGRGGRETAVRKIAQVDKEAASLEEQALTDYLTG